MLEAIRAGLPANTEIELWWHDEARVGQKNTITRRWARRGTRPSAPKDQRTLWTYLFGAICPAKGKGAGLVLPYCDTEAMAAQLEEISQAVTPGAHARPSRMAPHAEAEGARHHLAPPATTALPGVEPS